MTIVFSGVSHKLIVMTIDSAVTLDFDDGHREYSTGRKAYLFDGIGCVATWGVRNGNRLGDYLHKQNLSAKTHSVTDLADLVYSYLTKEYKPKDLGFDDVGYHVAGFDKFANPRIYHVFWGFDRPRPPTQLERQYNKQDRSPKQGVIQFVYNGRNDLAETVVTALLNQINACNALRFNLNVPLDLACFGDFVARFAAEITPEVGPPFRSCLISPSNKAEILKNDIFCPIERNKMLVALRRLSC